MALDKEFRDIPGTIVFDAEQSRKGYWLNQFCMSLMKAENRARFKADERAYLDEWKMTEEQKQAVLDRDLNRMMALGGNIYFLSKIGATDGKSFQQMAGSMTGMSEEEYRDMMIERRPLDRGQPPDRRGRRRAAPAGRTDRRLATRTRDHGPHHRLPLHLAHPRHRRGLRPRQDAGGLLEAGVRRLRLHQGMGEGAQARRDLSRLQRPRHRLQPRDDPDLRDHDRPGIQPGRRRLRRASGAEGDRPSGARLAHRLGR